MALTLPYPELDFVPLDILTAEEMNEIVANYTYIANQFPLSASALGAGSVTYAKLGADIGAPETIIDYTVDSDASADVYVAVPTDFSTYWQIVIDVSYEANNTLPSGTVWGELNPMDGSTILGVKRTGHEFRGTEYERKTSDGQDHVLAIAASYDSPSQGHVEMDACGPNRWVTYRSNSVGGSSTALWVQDFWGKVTTAANDITSINVQLRNPKAGGKVVAYGYRR